ncbi:hypothetical protein ACFWDN_31295 [Micromonospora chalcea]
MTNAEITPALLDAAGITPAIWRRLIEITGDSESAREHRGGWALRRLRRALDGDQEVSQ